MAGQKSKHIAAIIESNLAGSGQLLDLSTATGFTVIDDDVADAVVADGAKPGAPTYTKTILAANIPANDNVSGWTAIMSVAGKNNGVGARTINWRFTKNGVDIDATDGSRATTADQFWNCTGQFALTSIAAGDVLGIKLWDLEDSGELDLRAVTIYLVPREIVPAAADAGLMFFNDSTYKALTVAGAIAGVTYSALTSSPQIRDTSLAYNKTSLVNDAAYPILPGMSVIHAITGALALTDSNAGLGSASNAALTLRSLQTRVKYFNRSSII